MSVTVLVLLILSTLWGLTGCGSKENADLPANDQQAAYTADQQLYEDAAKKLVGTFMRDLQGELMSAMKDGGPENAIRVCNTAAPEIAAAHSAQGWTIKRVSERFRNPDNRADTTELAVLARFADTTGAPEIVANWTEIDSLRTFHFYKPIRVGQLCLNCHGGVQTLVPGVYQKLKKYYPADRAVGYKAGDLRGMFVVEAPWPDGVEYARQLLNPDTTTTTDTIAQ